jgi:hypothetical protein
LQLSQATWEYADAKAEAAKQGELALNEKETESVALETKILR